MNNYCWFCGKKLNEKDTKCQDCEALVFEKRVDVEKRYLLNQDKKMNENALFIITLILPICAILSIAMGLHIVSPIMMIGFLICLVSLRKKYFYSVKVKVLTSFVVICVILFLLFILWICIECGLIHPGLKELYV